MKIPLPSSVRGELSLPGDKSISHRYAILGAMARGKTTILNYPSSQDCRATLNCVRAMGVDVRQDGHRVEVLSQGWRQFRQPEEVLDAQNSGTTIRLVSALLAGGKFVSTIQGDDSLNHRPMKRIIIPLTQMGAKVTACNEQYPPLVIQGRRLQGIRYLLPVASAQVKSCVLLAGLMAQGETTVVEPVSSRDHTERALPFFGVQLRQQDRELTVPGDASPRGAHIRVPGDFSAAAYFLIAALLLPGSELTLREVGVNPSRTALLKLLKEAGARIEESRHEERNAEPTCDLTVHYSREVLERFPSEIGSDRIPNLIDEIPILAVFGTRLKHGLAIRGAEELRRKESDRIHSTVSNLRSLGVKVEEFSGGFFVGPRQRILGGKVQTFADHRIAMAFTIAGLIAEGEVKLDQPDCTTISFPGFFESLQSICN